MLTVVCLGGGEIGRLGVQSSLREGARVLLVDPDEGCMARSLCNRSVDDADRLLDAAAGDVLYMRGDGTVVLADLIHRWVPDQVVPAAPGHLAARLAMEWYRRHDRELHPFGGPLLRAVAALPAGIVQLIDSTQGVMVTSYMPSGKSCCPECDRPPVCPVTGKERLAPMHRLVDAALAGAVDRRSVLVTVGEEVGILHGDDLKGTLDMLDDAADGATMGIATSCGCHAIVNLFRHEVH